MAIFYVFTFVLGLVIGSFINVVLFRLDREGGIFLGRSKCTKCLARLKWYDLFPLFSYLQIKGRCRYCKKKLSAIYPIVELTTACVITLYFLMNGLGLGALSLYSLFILLLLVMLVFFDILYLIIPDKVTLLMVASSFLFLSFAGRSHFYNGLISAFIFGTFFAMIYIISKGEWMGLGDAKLSFAIGLILGYPFGLFAIIISVWVAALFGTLLMALKKADLKTALPFGSFLSAVTILFVIFQNEIQKIQFINLFF
ncbi:MAG: hypothetical protein A3B99_03030 [Candidatus Yanofskybacteria bacterium RIFCSPHIGHO2_02_FULL_44_12b]|uniref:Prepilin peptidase n=2 Tax=Candidatus Yanofskyibacteriota TaxID=1752733 RepID=A0A1F8GPD1_9BACT|nr:MAG: Type 4 prepilin-like protein leader peptide-processing enzyme [Candidatus Yanofskybacteria bacterium GW2011_GWA2_44_9]OGN05498.1 MAG: hypothetical protein A2659_02805 [Candidatus Yanofskybacteria bacterium RIFCSPHIGHO2_01_FULL_44_24]OGN15049.1 MAG: hypothetical protein A3B99_03030 [Candidatus Yanofskybacteria bacterium RIFCSPHIGHO2_02_FULL_44_12b]OGN26518.1 MAG: hypothetical protein A2925_03175 [Candidatus Yanofskybacteria bacterium RIFCSPLOWO2_01_FULL_44_22]